MSVYVRSIMDGAKVRLRAVEGQKYDIMKNVQGSKEIRLSNPIGTIFECSGLEDVGSFYRAIGGLNKTNCVHVQHDPTISKTKKKNKDNNTPINIVEFI